jgi:hypothetical protein
MRSISFVLACICALAAVSHAAEHRPMFKIQTHRTSKFTERLYAMESKIKARFSGVKSTVSAKFAKLKKRQQFEPPLPDLTKGIAASTTDSSSQQNLNSRNTVPLYRDLAWYAFVDIGTPAQRMRVLLDTGSSNFWVRSAQCWTASCNPYNFLPSKIPSSDPTNQAMNHVVTHGFVSNQSSTFTYVDNEAADRIRLHQLHYNDGKVTFGLGADTVSLVTDPVNNSSKNLDLRAANQTFGLGFALSVWPFANIKIDGIYGLGFPELAIGNVLPPLFDLKAKNVIKSTVFSYWVGPNPVDLNGDSNATTSALPVIPKAEDIGELTVGGWNTDMIDGDIKWTPIVRPMFWELQIVGVKYGNVSIPLHAPAADGSVPSDPLPGIVDTGNTMVLMPKVISQGLANAMKSTNFPFFDTVAVNCRTAVSDLLPITILIAGETSGAQPHEFVLQPEQYLFGWGQEKFAGVFGTGRCLTAFSGASTKIKTDAMVLGEAFLRHFVSIWDVENKRFGLATRKMKTPLAN